MIWVLQKAAKHRDIENHPAIVVKEGDEWPSFKSRVVLEGPWEIWQQDTEIEFAGKNVGVTIALRNLEGGYIKEMEP